jgi:hypothetical protein
MGEDDIPGQSKGKILPSLVRQPLPRLGTEEDSCQELRMCSAPSKSRSCRARPYLPREPRSLLLAGSEGRGGVRCYSLQPVPVSLWSPGAGWFYAPPL